MTYITFLSPCAYAFIIYIFVQFLVHVNSSRIYQLTFILLLIDFNLLGNYDEKNNQDLLLYIPCIVLLVLYTIVVFEIGGWRNLFDYLSKTFTGHVYNPMTINSLSNLWPFFLNFMITKSLYKNMTPDKFLLSIIILSLNIIKELLKKNHLILFYGLYIYTSPFIFWLFFNHLFIFLILISLLAIDIKVVLFMNRLFGPYSLGWLGSYQSFNFSPLDIKFMHPSDFIFNNKKHNLIKDLQKIEANIRIIQDLLQKVLKHKYRFKKKKHAKKNI